MMLRFFAIALLLPLARGLSPRRLHVAAWQGAAKTADVAANVARVVDEAAAAAAAGVDVLVFPELFLHGYDATKDQLEATALRRDELGACAAAAEAHALCLAVPYCERRGSSLYNAMAVFDARGALAKNYRKVNLWGAWERDVFAPGAPGSFEPFDLETRSLTVRAGCLICFDVEFPEPARHLAVAGAELLLALEALQELVEDVDNARDLMAAGGFAESCRGGGNSGGGGGARAANNAVADATNRSKSSAQPKLAASDRMPSSHAPNKATSL